MGCDSDPLPFAVDEIFASSLSRQGEVSPLQPIQPISYGPALDSRKVKLGDQLFHDRRLSHDNSISCASCHSLATGGTDQAFRSVGINGALGGINTPTVFNSSLNFRQFWDGRARTLEEQIEGPTQHPKEMGSTWPEILGRIRADALYQRTFADLYPEGIQRETVKDAIATFERSLLTTNSRFDQFLRGDPKALTSLERHGYQLFTEYGCTACHQGANVGGNLFQEFGIFGNYFEDLDKFPKNKPKELAQTGHEGHRHVVKVPSLRVAVLTPPYFHDGSAATLSEAVKVMAKYQLGRSLAEDDVDAIVAFLRTLPGEYKGKVL